MLAISVSKYYISLKSEEVWRSFISAIFLQYSQNTFQARETFKAVKVDSVFIWAFLVFSPQNMLSDRFIFKYISVPEICSLKVPTYKLLCEDLWALQDITFRIYIRHGASGILLWLSWNNSDEYLWKFIRRFKISLFTKIKWLFYPSYRENIL